MIIDNIPDFKCQKCLKKFEVPIDDYEIDLYSYERSMGEETQFSWSYTGECPICRNEIEITLDVYEYPRGMLNFQDSTTQGCTIVNPPTFRLQDENI